MAGVSGGGGGSSAVRAGRAYVEFEARTAGLDKAFDRVRARMQSFGAATIKVGATAAAAGVAGLAPMVKILGDLNDIARQGAIGSALGLTAEQFTGIAGIAKAAGGNTKEFIESLVTLGKVASEGAIGKGEVAGQFFKDINVNAKDFVKLRADEQFFRFFEAVQKVEDPLARVRAVMVAFGEDGGKLLLPLLKKTPEQLRAMAKGFEVSTEDMIQAEAAQLAYAETTNNVSKAWRQVVIAVAPAVKRVAEAVAAIVKPVAEWVKQNKALVTGFFGVAAGLTAAGGALVAFGLGFKVAGATIGLFAMAVKGAVAGVGLLANPFVLAGVAVAGLIALWAEFTDAGRSAVSNLKAAFADIAATAKLTLGGISDAIKSGNMKLAFEIAGEGIKAVWFKMLAAMAKAFAAFIADNRDKLIALSAILTGVKGAKLGGRLGPWGALIGGGVGAAAGGFGADALADELVKLGDTPGLDAKAAAAVARLKELAAQAKMEAGAAGGAGGMPGDPFTSPGEQRKLFDAVKGAFNVPVGRQQFGYGDKVGGTVEDKQLEEQKKIKENTAKTAQQMAQFMNMFLVR